MASDVTGAFSQTYAEARAKFLAAAERRGLDVESHPHPLLGRDGEAMAMDVVRDGPAGAPAVLLVSSACHGVEGYCGAGVQVALLDDDPWCAAGMRSGPRLPVASCVCWSIRAIRSRQGNSSRNSIRWTSPTESPAGSWRRNERRARSARRKPSWPRPRVAPKWRCRALDVT